MCKDHWAVILSWPADHTVYPNLAEASLSLSMPMYFPLSTHFTALVRKCKQSKLGQPPFNTTERGEAAIMNYP